MPLPIPIGQGTLPGVVLGINHCLVLLRYILLPMSPAHSIVYMYSKMVTVVEHFNISETGFLHKTCECF